ncbi:uncharacterized protein LOC126719526 [Quercus robur]|uniref:uncharacterized protein LOC126719526 n=1 Tax=Quercus robur TaxID=38942 RepID=UPI0021618A84|nr:uncharacterized protein LOC126719526 [Quercus robur]
MVSQRGIEANLEKVKAILDITSPRSVKEVQKLTGRIAALNRPRTIIKAQALADFVAEFTIPDQDLKSDYWTVYTNGSSTSGINGVGAILLPPEKYILKYGVRLQFPTTNNEAEYVAILMRLRFAKAMGVRNLKLNSDSKLMIGQMNNEYEAKEDRMKRYLAVTS